MQIRKTSAQEGPAEEQRTKWSLTAAAFSVTRACSPNPSRGPRYLGRCLVGPSGVPGHRDLSSGLHPHALLLLSLLLLQDRARERAQGVRGRHTHGPPGPAWQRPRAAGGDHSQERSEGPLSDPPRNDSERPGPKRHAPPRHGPRREASWADEGRGGPRGGMLHAHSERDRRTGTASSTDASQGGVQANAAPPRRDATHRGQAGSLNCTLRPPLFCSSRTFLPRRTRRHAALPGGRSAGHGTHRRCAGAACRPHGPWCLSPGRMPAQTLPRGRPARAPAQCPFHSAPCGSTGGRSRGPSSPLWPRSSLPHARRSPS